MTDHHIDEDSILSSPLELAKTIHEMAQGDDPSTTLDEGEASDLAEKLEANRGEKGKGKTKRSDSHRWEERKVGPSGNPKAPEIIPQSKSIIEDDAGESSPVASVVHDLDNDDEVSDDVEEGDAPSPSPHDNDYVTSDDLFELSNAIEDLIAKRLVEERGHVEFHVAALRQEIDELRKTVSDLSLQVSNLRIEVQKGGAGSAHTTRAVATSSSSSRQSATVLTPSTSSSHARRASDLESVEVSGKKELIEKFLAENPVYPRINVVRGAKLAQLANSLGFKKPTTAVTANDWNAPGLLIVLTREN